MKKKTTTGGRSKRTQSSETISYGGYTLDDLRDAGLANSDGVVDQHFAKWLAGSQLPFALNRIGAEVDEVIARPSGGNVPNRFDAMEIEFARSVRGCLNLCERHRQKGEVEKAIDRTLQAVTMWYLRPGKVYHTYDDATDFIKRESHAKLMQDKRRKEYDHLVNICMELSSRKKAKPKKSYTEIAGEMSSVKNSDGTLKWGKLDALRRCITKGKKHNLLD